MMKSQPFQAAGPIGTFAVVGEILPRQGKPTTAPPGAVPNGMIGGTA